jgi:hypothetical protein
MHAQAFIRKWRPGGPAHALNERAGAQPHEALDTVVAAGLAWAAGVTR